MESKVIAMLGIDIAARQSGGIWAVVDVYRRAGLFDRWPIRYIGTVTAGSAASKLARAAAALARYLVLLARNRIALVHVHSASNASFWRKSIFVWLALAARRPVIFHLHGGGFIDFYSKRCGRARRWLVRSLLNRVTHIIVLSEAWRRRISEITPNPRISAIANPVDPDLFADAGRFSRASNVLLFLGRLGEKKGVPELLEALARVRTRVPGVRLWLAGTGNTEEMKRRASAQGVLEAVEFLGWVSGAEKARVLGEATVYVLPSHTEGMPMAVLESMAAGLPVVASRVGGIPDLVEHQVHGILIAPGDVGQLTDALIALLQDSPRCAAMGVAARERIAERYSAKSVLPQVEALYLQYAQALTPAISGAAAPNGEARPCARAVTGPVRREHLARSIQCWRRRI